MFVVRPEQHEFVAAIRQSLKVRDTALAVMSTGGGKTVAFSALASAVYADYGKLRVLFVVDRLPLITQIFDTLTAFSLKAGVYCGSLQRYEIAPQFVVSTIQTISRIQVTPHFDLVVIDEAHSMTGEHKALISRLLAVNARLKVLGVTATPFTAKGYIYGEKKFFRSVCFEKGLNELTALGRLVPAKLNGPKLSEHVNAAGIKLGADGDYSVSELEALLAIRSRIESQVDDALPRVTNRKKIIWACVSIKHARMLEGILLERAESAVTVASDVSLSERNLELGSFTAGNTRHLCFVSVVAKGFDYPPIDAVVFLRPTKSPALYLQIVGRGLRSYPGKQDCLVLDFCRVVETNGPLDAPFVKGAEKLRKAGLLTITKDIQAFHCDTCGAFYFATLGTYPNCPECGQAQDTDRLARQVNKQARMAKKQATLYASGAHEGILWHRVTHALLQEHKGAVSIRLHLLDTAPIPYFDIMLPTEYKPTPAAMGRVANAKRMLVRFFGADERHSMPKMIEALRIECKPPELLCLSAKTHRYMTLSFAPPGQPQTFQERLL